ncbi:hypothetical protein D021_1024B, partial [Vibrio parahaemolyticus 10296]
VPKPIPTPSKNVEKQNR